MGAERDITRRFRGVQSENGLKLLPVAVNQADRRQRHSAYLRGQQCDVIKLRLRGGIKNAAGIKPTQTLFFVFGNRRRHEAIVGIFDEFLEGVPNFPARLGV
jgi:hypothetical protein